MPAAEAMIPERGYLADYVDYATGVSMAPPEFHLACGLAQMSAIIGNHLVFSLGSNRYPPHLWIILLGRAGAKKSSAISLMSDILDEATAGKLRLPSEQTREALWDLLAERPSGYLAMSELMSFLERSKRDYMAGIREDLCDFFDSPVHRERQLRKGPVTIQRPSVTIVGAAVTDVLSTWVRHRDLAGGFLSRFLLIPQTSATPYIGMVPPDDPHRSSLVTDLRHLAGKVPELMMPFEFGIGARAAWEEFDEAAQREPVTQELAGWQNRLGLYAAKLACCYALARGHIHPEEEDVVLGCLMVEYANHHVRQFVEQVVSSQEGEDLRRVRNVLERLEQVGAFTNGDRWLSYGDALRHSHMTTDRFDRYIKTLAESGELEIRRVATTGRPRRDIRIVGRVEEGGRKHDGR